MDFDFASSAAGTTSKKKAPVEPTAPGAPPTTDTKRVEDFSRLMSGSSKESTPVASATGAGASKKRKAAGGAPQHAQTPPVHGGAAASIVGRKPGFASAAMPARETNVMSFGRHKSTLNKKGELVADDGTKLAVNGKRSRPNPSPFLRCPPTPHSVGKVLCRFGLR